jgi:replicative DNA helicase
VGDQHRAERAVHDGKVVAVFSLEMSKESLLRRMLASEALVNSRKIQTGFLPRKTKASCSMRSERLMESKMFIDDTPGITLAEMRAKARRLKQQEGRLDLIVIDYLQLMTGSAGIESEEVREPDAGGLGCLARVEGAGERDEGAGGRAVAALAWSEQRTGDKKPLLSICANRARSSRMPTWSRSFIARSTTTARTKT